MSILSSIGNAVYNTVSSIFGGTSQSATALNFNNPVNNALQAKAPLSGYGTPSSPTGVSTSGTQYYNNYTPTNKTGFTPVSNYSGLTGNIPTGVSFGQNPAVNIGQAVKGGGLTPSGIPIGLNSAPVYSFGGIGYQPSAGTTSQSFSTNSATNILGAQTAPTSVKIGLDTLGAGTTTANMPSAPSGTNYLGNVLAGNTGVGGDPKTGMITGTTGTETGKTDPAPTEVKTKSVADRIQELLGLYKTPANEADSYNKAVQQTGLLQARIQKQNTQNSINAITTKMNTDLLQLRGTAAKEGVTEAVYGGQQAEVTREATIKLLPLQAQLAVDQGNLEMATENTNTLFKIYADDAKNSVDFYNKNVQAAYDLFTEDEKKKAADILWQKNYNADVIKTDSQNQATIANELIKAGDMAGYRAVTAIRPPTNMQSPTFAQDYANYKQQLNQAVGQYGSSIGSLDRLTKQQDYQNAVLQGQKLANEVASGKPATGEYANVVNGAGALVSSTNRQAVQSGIANAIAGGDFKTAYANIGNAVADKLTGSAKTKFEDTLTDVGVMQGMRNAIQQYVASGGDIGFLKGSADNIAKKFGQLATDPKFAALGVQLQREFQSYRLGMTGAAFSPAESREYEAVNPRTNATLDLNLATIDGALSQLTNRVTSTVNARIPDAQKIYDLAYPQQTTDPLGVTEGWTTKIDSKNNPLGL